MQKDKILYIFLSLIYGINFHFICLFLERDIVKMWQSEQWNFIKVIMHVWFLNSKWKSFSFNLNYLFHTYVIWFKILCFFWLLIKWQWIIILYSSFMIKCFTKFCIYIWFYLCEQVVKTVKGRQTKVWLVLTLVDFHQILTFRI